MCGTKRDLLEEKERAIDYHDTTDYADTISAKLFETSSKTGENIGMIIFCRDALSTISLTSIRLIGSIYFFQILFFRGTFHGDRIQLC